MGHATGGVNLKEQLIKDLEDLPPDKLREVVDFVSFLRGQRNSTVPSFPSTALDRLTGLVRWGGDALAEAEKLYDDSK